MPARSGSLRGVADLVAAADASPGGGLENVYWKLFKLEMARKRQEHELRQAEQRAVLASRRLESVEARMRALLGTERVSSVGPRPSAAAAPALRYGVRGRP